MSDKYKNIWIISPMLGCQGCELITFIERHIYFLNDGGNIVVKVLGLLDKEALDSLNIKGVVLIQESDHGLYEAWNQALQYLISINISPDSCITFLGLDDTLCQNFCESVAKNMDKNIDFIYGDIYSRLGNRYRRRYAERTPLLFQKKSKYVFDIFHPGMMNRWGLISSFKFDQRYYLAADLDFYIRLSESHNITYLYIDGIQSIVGADGISNDVNAKEVYKKEWEMIEDKLSVEIVKKSNRMTILSVISKNKTLYKLIRDLYWKVVAKRKFKC
jgi:hypothetical protein